MTANQLAYQANLEKERANRENERLTQIQRNTEIERLTNDRMQAEAALSQAKTAAERNQIERELNAIKQQEAAIKQQEADIKAREAAVKEGALEETKKMGKVNRGTSIANSILNGIGNLGKAASGAAAIGTLFI